MRALLFFIFIPTLVLASPILETSLNYELKLNHLKKGDFQYFYGLLIEIEKNRFINLFQDQSQISSSKIIKKFMPLDIDREWKTEENHHLAVAKMNYILPTPIHFLTANVLKSQAYLQQTLPHYPVTKKARSFHVGGSLLTPEFDMKVTILKKNNLLLNHFNEIDSHKISQAKMIVSLMQQQNFGTVMFFQTAKMANTISIYEYLDDDHTLVTQYILSNIINVPTRNMIRNGMIENIQSVVEGTRKAVKIPKLIGHTNL